MKSAARRTALAVSLFALPLTGTPLLSQGTEQQRGGPPRLDAPRIAITTFQSGDRELGIAIADELRRRLQQDHSAQELFVIPRQDVEKALATLGQGADSALRASELMSLALLLRDARIVDGKAKKHEGLIEIDARLLLRQELTMLAQPLPHVSAADVLDAATLLERAITDASKAVPSFSACTNDLRAAKYDEAIAEGRNALAAYPRSTFARFCILSAYTAQKAPPDSIIAVASALRSIDSTSAEALTSLAQAYDAKHDTANAVRVYLAIHRLVPRDSTSAFGFERSIPSYVGIAILDSLFRQDPRDANLLRSKWLLQLRAKQYKAALATGAEMIELDSAMADLDYYERSIVGAGLETNTALEQQLILQGLQKFGNKMPIAFPLLAAQLYYKAGRLEQALAMARRASAIDPKNVPAWEFQVILQIQMKQGDSTRLTARKAVAAGVPTDTLGASLVRWLGSVAKKAQDAKDQPLAAWDSALQAAEQADAIAPSPGSKFYVGLAAFHVGLDALEHAQTIGLEAQKLGANAKEKFAQACSETMLAERRWQTAAIALRAGEEFNKETAAEIYGDMRRRSPDIPQMKKAFCDRK